MLMKMESLLMKAARKENIPQGEELAVSNHCKDDIHHATLTTQLELLATYRHVKLQKANSPRRARLLAVAVAGTTTKYVRDLHLSEVDFDCSCHQFHQ